MTKKQMQLDRARVCGYNGDKAGFARLVVERKGVKFDDMKAAYALGEKQKEQGYII